MTVVWIALPVTLLLAAGFVAAFIWSAKRGQFDDTDTPPLRMLLDDEPVRRTSSEQTNKKTGVLGEGPPGASGLSSDGEGESQ